jgi:arsenite methyltransferase
MNKESEIKEMVKEKYSSIAGQAKNQNASSCCGATASCCEGEEIYNIMADDYTQVEGYASEADLGLGCGMPTAFARIRTGDTVVDLGSGAGNDCFVARRQTGPEGKVIGIDFTEKMVELARANAEKLGYNNVEFREGDIEIMPLGSNQADVVISNCVLNLVPNKALVFREIYRVLKAGGHFSVSDIVLEGELPPALRNAAEMYAGCVAGAIPKKEYLDLIAAAGFSGIQVQKEKKIVVPDNILENYLGPEEMELLRKSDPGIYSITVYAEKPAPKANKCCEPGSGCC